MKLPKIRLPRTRPTLSAVVLLVVELLGALAILYGVSWLWGDAVALIVGGVGAVVAVEMQSRPSRNTSREDREIKQKIDNAVSVGHNPFENEDVPMSEKWLAYAHLVARKV